VQKIGNPGREENGIKVRKGDEEGRISERQRLATKRGEAMSRRGEALKGRKANSKTPMDAEPGRLKKGVKARRGRLCKSRRGGVVLRERKKKVYGKERPPTQELAAVDESRRRPSFTNKATKRESSLSKINARSGGKRGKSQAGRLGKKGNPDFLSIEELQYTRV